MDFALEFSTKDSDNTFLTDLKNGPTSNLAVGCQLFEVGSPSILENGRKKYIPLCIAYHHKIFLTILKNGPNSKSVCRVLIICGRAS